ncbi:MAG TPA: protein arginine kinase [Gemmatimonadaceae bacterium]|nr:protein arginine kinase [Gemmatimonadaceae bacterium]
MSFDPETLPGGGLGWMDGTGEQAGVVLSTRVRLARNVEGYAFSGRAREGERLRVLSQVRDALSVIPAARDGVLVRVDQLEEPDRQLLHERHVVSKELAALDTGTAPRSGAAVHVGRDVAIMVNEEDHLRIQAMRSGLDLDRAFADARDIDVELGQRVPFAYHREFGFLTACPTNVGTGLRASVLVHLPALVLTKEIGRVLVGLQQVGLTYRGLYGEGSEVIGNLFQISNQTTLGKSEQDLLDYLQDIVRHVIEKELEARKVLLRDAEYILEDKLWRAYGTLRYARSLSFDEAMNFLSGVRLAAGLKLIDGLSVYILNELLVFTQSAHLSAREGRVLTEDEASVVRAAFVRETLERAAQ